MTKAEEFAEILAEAGAGGQVREHPGNPSGVAEEFIREWAGRRCVWRGDFYRYTGTHWEKEEWADVKAEINNELRASVYWKVGKDGESRLIEWNPNNTSLSNLETQIRLQAALPSTLEPVTGGHYVFLENGRFNLITGRLEQHDPTIFNLHASPFGYDKAATCPTWDAFIKQTFDGDQDSIDTHYLWMAYELLAATDLQKAYMLLGQPRSGKGTIMRIQDALIGPGQVTSMSLRDFGSNFGMQSLVGKSVCRINDARDAGTANVAAVERLLGIVGGDAVQIDRKGVAPWVGRLGVRFTLASNEEIRLPDASGAIVSRFIFNRTAASHLGHEDFTLADRILKNEMPGVLNRVLDYIDHVYEKWPENKRVTETVVSMQAASQPLRAWVEDNGIHIGPEYAIARGAAYHGYKAWAEENGYRHMNVSTFGRHLRAWLSGLQDVKIGPAGDQERYYIGLGYETVEQIRQASR